MLLKYFILKHIKSALQYFSPTLNYYIEILTLNKACAGSNAQNFRIFSRL